VTGVPENLSGEPPSRGRLSAWLQERLFDRRIVLVTGWFDDALAAQTAAELMTLDATSDEPVEPHLDSPDGTLEAAFVLIDTLDLLHAPVRAHLPGSGRWARDRCRGRCRPSLHLGTHAVSAHPADAALHRDPYQIASSSQRRQDLLWRLQARLARVTSRPIEEIADDMRRGRYLDAREALEYGLLDAISTTAP
jgi:ATP-dependent Clp protease protease subunit